MKYDYKAFLATLAVSLILTLAGCGGGEGDGGGEKANPPEAAIGGAKADSATPAPKSEDKDTLHPVVLVETSLGNIKLKLDAENAEITVRNFLDYVESGHYDNTIVHRVYRSQGIVGGGYGPDLTEKQTRTPIYNEALNGLKNRRGTIAMVRDSNDIHSARSQFFINLSDNPELDHKDHTLEGYGYCVFGQVVEGMDIVDRIGAADVEDKEDFDQIPVQTVLIKSMRLLK